jgi:hypothetical protein
VLGERGRRRSPGDSKAELSGRAVVDVLGRPGLAVQCDDVVGGVSRLKGGSVGRES